MNFLPVLWTIISFRTHLASGLPLTKPTITTVGWVSDEPHRGTLSIITSCILTMGLCVWSALHLNIPSSQHSAVQFWLRNVKWMLVGLLAPELVVFAAWRQFVSAKTLQEKINGLASRRSELSMFTTGMDKNLSDSQVIILRDPLDWTLVHSFYAGMGGFVFDLNAASTSKLRSSRLSSERLTLTPRGIALLAECGLLPGISKEEIADKSKADDLAKALVCLQAGWMVIQVVGRVAYRLPVTLLEINTIGHVICAFVIYVLWWHKPKLIHEPTSLGGEWTEAVCAYMWMSSRISDPHRNKLSVFGKQSVPELTKLAFYPCHPASDMQGFSGLEPKLEPEGGNDEGGDRDNTALVKNLEDHSLPTLPRFAYKEDFGYLGPIAPHVPVISTKGASEQFSEVSLPPLEQNSPPDRWRLALDAMQRFPAICKRMSVDTDSARCQRYRLNTEELLWERSGNWPSSGLLNNFRGLLMGMALWFASMAFGGVHAAAWNEYFPSVLESWLWRSCSVYIMASGFIWFCINFLGQISHSFNRYWDSILAGRASRTSYVIVGFLCTICGLAYGFARIFLIVEAVYIISSAAYDHQLNDAQACLVKTCGQVRMMTGCRHFTRQALYSCSGSKGGDYDRAYHEHITARVGQMKSETARIDNFV